MDLYYYLVKGGSVNYKLTILINLICVGIGTLFGVVRVALAALTCMKSTHARDFRHFSMTASAM